MNRANYKRLGDYIQLVNNRNKDLAIFNLLGVNIFKNFMPSVANQSGLDLSKYKVIKKGQFATNLMHVNRDEVLPVGLYSNEQPQLLFDVFKEIFISIGKEHYELMMEETIER
jgi:type I restriction enzyme S subunit